MASARRGGAAVTRERRRFRARQERFAHVLASLAAFAKTYGEAFVREEEEDDGHEIEANEKDSETFAARDAKEKEKKKEPEAGSPERRGAFRDALRSFHVAASVALLDERRAAQDPARDEGGAGADAPALRVAHASRPSSRSGAAALRKEPRGSDGGAWRRGARRAHASRRRRREGRGREAEGRRAAVARRGRGRVADRRRVLGRARPPAPSTSLPRCVRRRLEACSRPTRKPTRKTKRSISPARGATRSRARRRNRARKPPRVWLSLTRKSRQRVPPLRDVDESRRRRRVRVGVLLLRRGSGGEAAGRRGVRRRGLRASLASRSDTATTPTAAPGARLATLAGASAVFDAEIKDFVVDATRASTEKHCWDVTRAETSKKKNETGIRRVCRRARRRSVISARQVHGRAGEVPRARPRVGV